MKITKLLLAVLVLPLGSSAQAQTTNWTGGGGASTLGTDAYGNWTDGANWDTGSPPGVNTNLNVVIGAVVANGGRVVMDGIGNELWIGNHPANKIGSLTLTGGTLQMLDGLSGNTTRIGDQGPGVLTQTGGNFFMNSGEMRIGNNNNGGGNGLYDISGGTFSTMGGRDGGLQPQGNVMINRNKVPSSGNASLAEFRISGTATVNLGLADTGGAALGFGTGIGASGSSILSVIGSEATINIHSFQMINALYGASDDTNRIKVTFDESGPSLINITGNFDYAGDSASAILAQGLLGVTYTGGPLAGGTFFDVMVGDKIVWDPSFGLDPAAASAGWGLSLLGDNEIGGGSDTLRLTFIPEPSSALLLGLGGFLLARRRRA
jgi:hypothetical protein